SVDRLDRVDAQVACVEIERSRGRLSQTKDRLAGEDAAGEVDAQGEIDALGDRLARVGEAVRIEARHAACPITATQPRDGCAADDVGIGKIRVTGGRGARPRANGSAGSLRASRLRASAPPF